MPALKKSTKVLCLMLFWSILLYSCKEVSFREPQPAGVSPLQEVPKSLQGQYRGMDNNGNDTDTLFVESWGYHFKDGKNNDWLGRGVLNDSLVLKYYENYYFINFRSGKQWVLRVIKPKSSGSLEFMSIDIGDDSRRKSVLKKLSKRFEVREFKGKEDTFYQIAPTKEQLIQLIRDGFFSGDELEKIH